jgi:Domain of unknown function (DUF5666)
MKRMIVLVVVLVLAAGDIFAHDEEQRVMGTVTAITGKSISVQTPAKDSVTVYTTSETKYEKSGAPASMKDLKLGDRVVIYAAPMARMLMANEVHFGAAKTPPKSH